MPDHREPHDADRSRLVADRPEAGDGRTPGGSPSAARPGQSSKEAAIKAVSDLLSLRKPASAPRSARLPKFPRSLEATASELRKSPGLRLKPGPPPTSLEAPPVGLPGDSPTSRAGGGEAPGGSITGGSPDPGVEIDDPRSVALDSRSARVGLENPAPPPEGRGDGPGPVPSPIPIRQDRVTPIPSGAPSLDGRIADRGPGSLEGLPGAPGNVRAASIGLPGPDGPASRSGTPGGFGANPLRPGVSASGAGAGAGAGSSRVEAPAVAVRNRLATAANLFSAGPRDFPARGGTGAGPDAPGIGAVSGLPSFGGAATPQGGGAGDLSKTNELLRQLIDAVKKQRDASLPVGGQSVYPAR